MKKKFAVLLVLLTAALRLDALPLGNPAEPLFLNRGVFWGGFCQRTCDPCGTWLDFWSLRVGYYGDFVYNNKLKVHNPDVSNDNIHRTQIFTNAGYFVINLGNRIDIFGTAGVSKMKITQEEETWATTLAISGDSMGFLETNSDFSWSAGARAALIDWCGVIVGIEGQYFEARPKFNRYFSTFSAGNSVFFDEHNRVKFKEWQAGVGASYLITCQNPFWKVIPYAGIKWSWSRFTTKNFQFTVPDILTETERTLTIFNLREQFHIGYALGVSLTAWGNSALTLEGRWLNEKALYFNAQFRF